jgi:hypothetical protein
MTVLELKPYHFVLKKELAAEGVQVAIKFQYFLPLVQFHGNLYVTVGMNLPNYNRSEGLVYPREISRV